MKNNGASNEELLIARSDQCYESKPLGLNDEVILYRVYTRELNGRLCTE